MKEQVTKFDLEAAFKALDEIGYAKPKGGIRSNRIDLSEAFTKKLKTDLLIEDYYDVNDSEDLADAKDVRDDEIAKAKLARIEKIVDLDAESPEDLLPSYVGKYIIQCPQCMTLFYKDKEDIEESEDDPNTVNVNETCQHCGNNSGYTLIGKVDNISPEETANYQAAEENNNSTEEEQPAEEANNEEQEANNEEQPAEENAEENKKDDLEEFDLNLDTEEENKNESLNLSDAQKEAEKNSALATENKSENRTLNEDIAKDEENDLLAELVNKIPADIRADLAVTTDTAEDEAARDVVGDISFNFNFDENTIAKATELVNAVLSNLDTAKYRYQIWSPDALSTEGCQSIDEVVKEATEQNETDLFDEDGYLNISIYHLNEPSNESLNEDKRDDDDYYGRDIDDAVIQLKKKGHAEFWCLSDGKKKAEEVKKIVKDKYGKDVEYTITDGYCEAKIVESLTEGKLYNNDLEFCQMINDGKVKPNPYALGYLKLGELSQLCIDNHLDKAYDIIEKAIDKITDHDDEDAIEANNEWDDIDATSESLNNSEAQKDAEKNSELATENKSENKSLNEAKVETLKDVKFTEADVDSLINNELSKPVNDEEIEAIIASDSDVKESVDEDTIDFEADIDDIDECKVESIITESLLKVYNNIRTFKLKECTLDENKNLVLEGLITFHSAKSKKIAYTFTEAKKENNKVILTGLNESLGTNSKFTLVCAINNKNLIAESFSYKYTTNNKLIEGLVENK